jgi:hypothetical protein
MSGPLFGSTSVTFTTVGAPPLLPLLPPLLPPLLVPPLLVPPLPPVADEDEALQAATLATARAPRIMHENVPSRVVVAIVNRSFMVACSTFNLRPRCAPRS